MLRTHAAQHVEVAAAALSETEIRTHPHFTGGHAIHQNLFDEFLGRHRRQLRIEAQQSDVVHAQLAQAFELGARQQQARGTFTAGEEFARQGFEAERHRRQAQFPGARQRAADQRLMPTMQAVESSDANHAALRTNGFARDVPEQLAHG